MCSEKHFSESPDCVRAPLEAHGSGSCLLLLRKLLPGCLFSSKIFLFKAWLAVLNIILVSVSLRLSVRQVHSSVGLLLWAPLGSRLHWRYLMVYQPVFPTKSAELTFAVVCFNSLDASTTLKTGLSEQRKSHQPVLHIMCSEEKNSQSVEIFPDWISHVSEPPQRGGRAALRQGGV